METRNLKSFSYLEDGTVSCQILAINETTPQLNSGFYQLDAVINQYKYEPLLSVLTTENIKGEGIKYKELEPFFEYLGSFQDVSNINTIESLGYKHKLGLILHGKQGTGKTVVTRAIADKVLKNNGIVININTSIILGMPCLLSFLKDLRKVHTQQMLFIFDECEVILKELENLFKNFLDGYDSIHNSISVFTTNYLDRVPTPIYERPSRIKFSIELRGISDEDTIEKMLTTALNVKPTAETIKSLMGCTADEIKEYIIDKILKITTKKDKKPTLGFKR